MVIMLTHSKLFPVSKMREKIQVSNNFRMLKCHPFKSGEEYLLSYSEIFVGTEAIYVTSKLALAN